MWQYIQYGLLFALLLVILYTVITYLTKVFTRRKHYKVLQKATQLQQGGDIAAALDLLEDNLKKFSFKDPIFASYISLMIAHRKYDRAKKIIKETAEKPEEKFAAINMLAYIATIEEDFETAEKYYKKALEIDPSKKQAIYTNLGVIYAEQGKNLDEAVEMLNEVIDLEDNKNKFPAYVNLGYALYQKGEYEQALITEKIGLELIPKGDVHDSIRAFAHYVIGMIFKAQAKKEDARSEFSISRRLVKNPAFIKKIERELNEIS